VLEDWGEAVPVKLSSSISPPQTSVERDGSPVVRRLYVHIPFCHHICPYCGFYKHQPGNLANAAFLGALLSELRQRAESMSIDLETIYFGGGTPSMLSRTHLETLCRGIAQIAALVNLEEWTLEANPATFDLGKARLMRELGVTRVSLGVQSWQPDTLKVLGRDHSPEEAADAFNLLREAGFENLNIDLMFSVPGQSADSWAADLEKAISLRPDHLSCYNLTYEEDTEFLKRHQSGELDANEDRDADLFRLAIDRLHENGFEQYEISNYARPGFESIHNRAYWSGADYLGIGPGAVSTVGNRRWKTLPDTAAYVRALSDGDDIRTEHEALTEADRRIEAIALQIRTREGVAESLLPGGRFNPVESLIEEGLIENRSGRVCLTEKGKPLADEIAAALA